MMPAKESAGGGGRPAGMRRPAAIPARRRAWEEDVVFITGFARTGTTLMHGLLCMSEDLMPVTTECTYLSHLIEAYVQARLYWLGYTYDQFADQDQFRRFHRRVVGAYFAQLRTHFATDRRLVQKAPQQLGRSLPAVADLLPNARFIVMLRDPRAVLASDMERWRRVGLEKSVVEQAREYGKYYRLIAGQLPALAGRLALVRYESLVTEPDAVMREVGAFLDVRLPPDLATRPWEHKRQQVQVSASPLDGKPVSTESLVKFRQMLPPKILKLYDRNRGNFEDGIGIQVYYEDGRPPGPAILSAPIR